MVSPVTIQSMALSAAGMTPFAGLEQFRMQPARHHVADQVDDDSGIMAGAVLAREIDRLVEQLLHAGLGDRHVVGVVIMDFLRLDDLAQVSVRPARHRNVGIGLAAFALGNALEP
jgi:hypothetical protein